MTLSMKLRIKFIITFFFMVQIIGEAQNCLKCTDTEYDINYDFSLLNSRFHLLQLFGDNSFHSSNYYDNNYNGNVGWIEGRLMFPTFSKFVKTQIPLPEPYITGLIKDLKDISWEKRFDYGVGIEWRIFKQINENLKGFNWIKHLRFYAVSLNTLYSQEVESWRPKNDYRFGVELYRECNIYKDYHLGEQNNDNYYFWSEFWADLSYRKTNFFIKDYNSWFFAFTPKYGIKLFPYKFYSLMPYLTGEVVVTSRSDFWQNRALLGIGARIMPFRKFTTGLFGALFRSCRFYFEYSNCVAYFKDKPTAQTPEYDLKFGISISIYR